MKISKFNSGDDDDESVPPEIHAMLTKVISVAAVAGIVSSAARFEAFLRAAVRTGIIELKFKNTPTQVVFSGAVEELFTRLDEAGYALQGDTSLLESLNKTPKDVNLPKQKHPHRN